MTSSIFLHLLLQMICLCISFSLENKNTEPENLGCLNRRNNTVLDFQKDLLEEIVNQNQFIKCTFVIISTDHDKDSKDFKMFSSDFNIKVTFLRIIINPAKSRANLKPIRIPVLKHMKNNCIVHIIFLRRFELRSTVEYLYELSHPFSINQGKYIFILKTSEKKNSVLSDESLVNFRDKIEITVGYDKSGTPRLVLLSDCPKSELVGVYTAKNGLVLNSEIFAPCPKSHATKGTWKIFFVPIPSSKIFGYQYESSIKSTDKPTEKSREARYKTIIGKPQKSFEKSYSKDGTLLFDLAKLICHSFDSKNKIDISWVRSGGKQISEVLKQKRSLAFPLNLRNKIPSESQVSSSIYADNLAFLSLKNLTYSKAKQIKQSYTFATDTGAIILPICFFVVLLDYFEKRMLDIGKLPKVNYFRSKTLAKHSWEFWVKFIDALFLLLQVKHLQISLSMLRKLLRKKIFRWILIIWWSYSTIFMNKYKFDKTSDVAYDVLTHSASLYELISIHGYKCGVITSSAWEFLKFDYRYRNISSETFIQMRDYGECLSRVLNDERFLCVAWKQQFRKLLSVVPRSIRLAVTIRDIDYSYSWVMAFDKNAPWIEEFDRKLQIAFESGFHEFWNRRRLLEVYEKEVRQITEKSVGSVASEYIYHHVHDVIARFILCLTLFMVEIRHGLYKHLESASIRVYHLSHSIMISLQEFASHIQMYLENTLFKK